MQSSCAACCTQQPRPCSPLRSQPFRLQIFRCRSNRTSVQAQPRSSARQYQNNLGLCLACVAAMAAVADPALALSVRTEPSNALSLPTWAIHISSVAEWSTGMLLMWTFAEVSNRPYWKAMSWGMMLGCKRVERVQLPSLGSAMCACTWHFFYNSPEVEWLVAMQAFLTVVGNFTLWMGAYHVYKKSLPTEAT